MGFPAGRALETVAAVAAAATLGLLAAPWMAVQTEPLCVRDPCPPAEARSLDGLEAAGAFVAALCVAAALLVVLVRRPAGKAAARGLAALLFAAAALLAAFWPEGPGFVVFARYDGALWGAWAAVAAAGAGALAAAVLSFAARARVRPTAGETGVETGVEPSAGPQG